MQPAAPLCCYQCGTVLSAPGGRCPACGVEQTNAAPIVSSVPRPAAPVRPPTGASAPNPTQKLVPWIVLGVGLAGIGAAAAAFAPRARSSDGALPQASARERAPEKQAPADPNDLGIQDRSAVDPSEILGRAKTRALAWNHDAVLVSLRAEPVVSGKVNLTSGGKIEYVFGTPTGEGFGPGAKVSGKRFTIRLNGAGTTVDEGNAAPRRAAMEPSCPIDEAVRKVQAAGVPPGTALDVSYEMSDKHQKAVWRASVPGDDSLSRTVDGWTCAILVR